MSGSRCLLAVLVASLFYSFSNVALADGYYVFEHYEMTASGEQYQLRGYFVVRYSLQSVAGRTTYIEGSSYTVPVANGRTVTSKDLFGSHPVLFRHTKPAASEDVRGSGLSSGSRDSGGTGRFGHGSMVNLDTGHKRRSRKSGMAGSSGSGQCAASVIPFQLNNENGAVDFDWVVQQGNTATAASAANSGNLTIKLSGQTVFLENVDVSSVHSLVGINDHGTGTAEDKWVMQYLRQELNEEELATLGRDLDRNEEGDVSRFKSASGMVFSRSCYSRKYPDPLWGTNCNWEHRAFYFVDTRQVGWQLTLPGPAGQNHLLMPVTSLPPEVITALEEMGVLVDFVDTEGVLFQVPTQPAYEQETYERTGQEDADGTADTRAALSNGLPPQPRSRTFSVCMGNERKWEALVNENYPNRSFFLRLIKGEIGKTYLLGDGDKRRLVDALDDQITQDLIDELVALGIVVRPDSSDFVSPVKKMYYRGDDDDRSDGSGGGAVGGGGEGTPGYSGDRGASRQGSKKSLVSSSSQKNGVSDSAAEGATLSSSFNHCLVQTAVVINATGSLAGSRFLNVSGSAVEAIQKPMINGSTEYGLQKASH